jgi:hypothetical protein
MYTPWGEADHVINLAKGVNWVNTPSHGGFIFTRCAAEKLLTEHARNVGEPWRNGLAFEEDCKYAIVLFEHPEYDAKLRESKDTAEQVKAHAVEVISRWDAEYLIARGLTPEPKAYAYYLQNKEQDKLRAEHSPDLIVAAFGDWANWVPKGRTGVITADDCRYTVPAQAYTDLQNSKGLTLLSRLHDVQPVAEVITVVKPS